MPSKTRQQKHASAPATPPTRTDPIAPAEHRKRRRARIDLKPITAAADPPALISAKPAKPINAAKAAKLATTTPLADKRPTTRAKLSALDAAAQVLAALTGEEAKLGITAQDLINRLARQKLWISPGGKTPQATLYAAMVREIAAKGSSARFRKVSKGHFAAPTTARNSATSRKGSA